MRGEPGRWFIVHKETMAKHPRQPKEGFESFSDAHAYFGKHFDALRTRKSTIRFIKVDSPR